MTIRIKFFAILRDRANRSDLTISLADGATIADALRAIDAALPDLKLERQRFAVAVYHEYVDPTTILCDGDELALIPPVSGG
jgi:sulfur-carrier protein